MKTIFFGMAEENGRINKQQETTHKDSTTNVMAILTTIKLEIDKILINMK